MNLIGSKAEKDEFTILKEACTVSADEETEWVTAVKKMRRKIRKISQAEEKSEKKMESVEKLFETDFLSGNYGNPLVPNPLTKSQCCRLLRRVVRHYMLAAATEFGFSQAEEIAPKALESLRSLNSELIRATLRCAGLSGLCPEGTLLEDSPFAAMPHKYSIIEIPKSSTEAIGCESLHCSLRTTNLESTLSEDAREELRYVVMSEGSYDRKTLKTLNRNGDPTSMKIVCLCLFHLPFFMHSFTFLHMEYNIYQNCLYRISNLLRQDVTTPEESAKSVVLRLPRTIIKNIESLYVARYGQLWVFEDEDESPRIFKMFGMRNMRLDLAVLLCIPILLEAVLNTGLQLRIEELFDTPGHTNNWAVLVCTSKFWFNYRHVSNVLALYHTLKRLGIPDSNIIMMLAEEVPCNARNPRPGKVYAARAGNNLYGSDVEVDYRGEEVTVENFIRVLTGRHLPATPRSKRLLTDHQSNVLVYLTGHGGDSFMKFQDAEELTNVDLAYAVQSMYEGNRSASMYEWIASPNVLSLSSSLTHQESYSYDVDQDIGVYVIDRYTHFTVAFMNKEVKALNSSANMQDYIDSCPEHKCLSATGVRRDTYSKDPTRVRVTDFFGSARIVQHLTEEVELGEDFWSFAT
ncbi:unnamed protein product [Caenorhabditis auriculariae]|uniref:Uncharacterized protein n=1 Tax=Caenorhabditis auriculariae TaxID=2777116 RepID=A0A8S1HKQ6_9PELO|nr:unnamed protein product [Caenorhabditis auriculariae]